MILFCGFYFNFFLHNVDKTCQPAIATCVTEVCMKGLLHTVPAHTYLCTYIVITYWFLHNYANTDIATHTERNIHGQTMKFKSLVTM